MKPVGLSPEPSSKADAFLSDQSVVCRQTKGCRQRDADKGVIPCFAVRITAPRAWMVASSSPRTMLTASTAVLSDAACCGSSLYETLSAFDDAHLALGLCVALYS